MDNHTRADELGQETEGAMLSEEEIKSLSGSDHKIDYPMPGEVADPEKEKGHLHTMPEGEVEIIDEDGKRII